MSEVEIIHDPRSAMLLPSTDPRRIALQEAVAKQLAEEQIRSGAAQVSYSRVPPTSAQCRAALREAVAKHQAEMRRLTELTQAVPKAESAVIAARSGVEQASAALEDAKREASSQAVAAAVGKAGGAAPSITKARRVLEAAQDDLEVAKAAAADLGRQHKEAEQAISMAQWRLKDAVASVIRTDSATQKLIEVFERGCRELAELRQAVELVASYFPQMERLAMLSERIDDALPSAKQREWETALAALETDADTPLPTMI